MAGASRLVELPAMRLAGFAEEYLIERFGPRLPLQWARLMGASPVDGQVSDVGYGLRTDSPEGKVHYIAAVEVSRDAPIASEFVAIDLPAARYAVIEGFDHVSQMRSAWSRIACSAAAQPFERYGEGFDPMLGRGDMTLWVPVDLLP